MTLDTLGDYEAEKKLLNKTKAIQKKNSSSATLKQDDVKKQNLLRERKHEDESEGLHSQEIEDMIKQATAIRDTAGVN